MNKSFAAEVVLKLNGLWVGRLTFPTEAEAMAYTRHLLIHCRVAGKAGKARVQPADEPATHRMTGGDFVRILPALPFPGVATGGKVIDKAPARARRMTQEEYDRCPTQGIDSEASMTPRSTAEKMADLSAEVGKQSKA